MHQTRIARLGALAYAASELLLLATPAVEASLSDLRLQEALARIGSDALVAFPPGAWYAQRSLALFGAVAIFFHARVGGSVLVVSVALAFVAAVVGGSGVGSAFAISVGYVSTLLQGAVVAAFLLGHFNRPDASP